MAMIKSTAMLPSRRKLNTPRRRPHNRCKTESAVETSTSPNLFFKLPLELRLIVYEFLTQLDEDAAPPYVELKSCSIERERWALSAEFLRTCRAIYAEYLPIVYKSCTVFASDQFNLMLSLPQLGGDPCSHITHITIHHDAVARYSDFWNPFRLHAMGWRAAPKTLPNIRGLSVLKTVTLKCFPGNAWEPAIPSELPILGEDFVKGLMRSKPKPGNVVRDLMTMLGDAPHVTWRVQCFAHRYERLRRMSPKNPSHYTGTGAVEEFKMDFEMKVLVIQKRHRESRVWQFKDSMTELVDEVTVWSCQPWTRAKSTDPLPWQQVKALRC